MICYNSCMKDYKPAKAYKIISVVILAMCIYFFLLPVISPLMERLLPELWTCPYLKLTGHECPFCGITRGVGSLYEFETSYASIVSMIAFLIVMIEAAFRIMLVLTLLQLKRKIVEAIIVTDVIYHLIMVIGVTIYVIMYMLNKF